VIPFKQKVFSLTRFLPLPERLYRHLHFRGAFTVLMPEGGDALAARAVNDEAGVEAFEPVDRVYTKLQINSSLNGNRIGTNHIALSNQVGTAELFDPGKDHVYSASLNANMLGAEGNKAKCVVPVSTLDAYVEAHGLIEPDLLKIDVEMHEPEVIEGALGVVSRARPAILIELLNAEISTLVGSLLPTYVFFGIVEGDGLYRSDRLDNRAGRNHLALPQDDPRVVLIGNSLEERAFYRLSDRSC
jgi:FkbM family methyltransferase